MDKPVFPKLDLYKMNLPMIRKKIRKKFSRFEGLCKFHRFPKKMQKLKKENKKIMELLFEQFNDVHRYESGNIHYLFLLMDSHFTFLKRSSQRIVPINSDQLLGLAHDLIFETNKRLIEVLIKNKSNPVSSEQLMEMYNEGNRSETEKESTPK